MLTGTEVKSLRDGRANISDAYGIVKDGEVFLLNLHISPVRTRGLHESRARPDPQTVAPPQGNPSFDRSRGARGTDPVPLELYFKNGSGEGGAGAGQGKETSRQARHRTYARRRARDGARGAHAMIALVLAAFQLRGSAAPTLVVRDATPLGARSDRRDGRRADGPRRGARRRCCRSTSVTTRRRGTRSRSGGRAFKLESGSSVVRVGDEVRPARRRAAVVGTDSCSCRFNSISEVFPGVRPEHALGCRGARSSSCSRPASRRQPAVAAIGASARDDESNARRRRRSSVRRRRATLPPVRSKHGRRTVDRRRGARRRRQRHDRPARRRSEDLREGHHARRREEARRRSSRRAESTSSTRARRDTLIALDDRGRIANRAQRRSVHLDSRERREPELEGSGRRRAASRRTSSPKRRPKTRAASSRWKTKPSRFEDRPRTRRQGRPAQLHPQRHGAERASARIERARRDHPAAAAAMMHPGRAAA